MAFTTLPARANGPNHRHCKHQRMVVQMPGKLLAWLQLQQPLTACSPAPTAACWLLSTAAYYPRFIYAVHGRLLLRECFSGSTLENTGSE